MAIKRPSEIFMSFAADEKMLEDIRRSVNDAIADVNLSNKDRNGILLAIEEACTNVIRHAYLYAPGTIRIKIRKSPTKVSFSIYDKGRRFDFDRATAATPDLDRYVKTGRKGGLGLYLIRKMMDSVDYISRDGENELRMAKTIQARAQVLPKPQGISIRLKFALWASLVVCAIIAAIFLYYDNRSSDTIRGRFFSEALSFAHTTALNAADKMMVDNELELLNLVASAIKGNPILLNAVVVDDSGRIWADAKNPEKMLSRHQYPADVDSNQIDKFQPVDSDQYGRIFYLIVDIPAGDRHLGRLHFVFSRSELAEQLSRSRRMMILFSLGGLLLGLGAVYLLSNYFVKPIQKLTEGVLKIGQGNLDETLPVEGSDEFSEIARAFNEITLKFKSAQVNIVEQERLQKEMQVAQEIQHALLPRRFPEIEGYELAAVYRAAKDVGGDYFDFVWIDENTMGIIVADVSGKGVPGSLVMTMIRTAIRLEARGNKSPSDILARVNDFVAEDVKKGMFITIYFIVLDSKERQISFSSAGHNPMILYRKDTDSCYFLKPKGIPLGLTLPDEISFRDSLQVDRLKLKKDDVLVIYTDGVTEAMNSRNEQYGNDRLTKFIREHSTLTPTEFAAALDQDIISFTGNAPQNDDITLVVIKEKIMADELVFEKRRRIIQMVEFEKVPVEEACKQMGISPATYYKYRKRWKQEGDAGLLNKKLRADEGIKHLSYSARQKLLAAIVEHPDYGSGKLQKALAEAGEECSARSVYAELVNLRLNSKAKRLAYVERVGKLKPEQREQLEKEMLREERARLDRHQYAEQLKQNLESRHIEKMAQDTGRIITQLKQFAPAGGTDIYDGISKELEKLDGGSEIASLFRSLVQKMTAGGGQDVENQAATIPAAATADADSATPAETAPEKARTAPIAVPKNAEKIDIISKALDPEGGIPQLPSEFDEYEKKLVNKFRK